MITDITETFQKIGIMTIKKYVGYRMEKVPEIIIGQVKLLEISYEPININLGLKNYPLRKYLVSALCPDEVMQKLLDWITVGQFYIHTKYSTHSYIHSDDFIGTIEEIGMPERNGDMGIQKYMDTEGAAYSIIIDDYGDAIRPRAETYIIFREQGR